LHQFASHSLSHRLGVAGVRTKFAPGKQLCRRTGTAQKGCDRDKLLEALTALVMTEYSLCRKINHRRGRLLIKKKRVSRA